METNNDTSTGRETETKGIAKGRNTPSEGGGKGGCYEGRKEAMGEVVRKEGMKERPRRKGGRRADRKKEGRGEIQS